MQMSLAGKLDIIDYKVRDVICKALDSEGYPYINMGKFGKISISSHINADYEEIWVFNKTHGMPIGEENSYREIERFIQENDITKEIYEDVLADMRESGNCGSSTALKLTLKELFEKYNDLKNEIE